MPSWPVSLSSFLSFRRAIRDDFADLLDRLGMLLEQFGEGLAIELQHLDVGLRLAGGVARLAGHHPGLADNLRAAQHRDVPRRAVFGAPEDFDLAAPDDVHRVAGLALQ